MAEVTTLLTGLSMGESVRWHEDRFWFSDWMAGHIATVGLDGATEVVHEVASFPFCFDWLADGRLVVVSGGDGRLLVADDEPGAELEPWASVADLDPHAWNEVVALPDGAAIVDGIGFDMMGGAEPGPGQLAHVAPDGTARLVAVDLAFPNGLALLDEGRTLLVAESHAGRLTAFSVRDDGTLTDRRTWAEVPDSAPDGICVDAAGAVWFAEVPGQRCVRVAEGGEVLDVVELDRGAFSCALGGPDGRTLGIVATEWGGPEAVDGAPAGIFATTEVEVPGAAWA